MSTGNRVIDANLNRTSIRWRWLRFLQHSGTLGAILCGAWLLLSCAMAGGWITEPLLAKTLIALIVILGLLCWLGLAVMVIEKELKRRWLAGLIERGQPKLLDRVHTLVALEDSRTEPQVAAFYRRIARQAQKLLSKQPPARALSPRRAWIHLAVFFLMFVFTLKVCDRLSPWQRMREARKAKQVARQSSPPPELSLELTPPQNVTESRQPWGEVRITDPARDLQVTKVDVVPLQIEAAANEALQKVGWVSTINGTAEQTHNLPAPPDPKYAVYQPTLYLDEYKLSDWDVLTYYGKADTRASNSFASEIYFLEVRPFREEILKVPGGENGQAMRCINELSALISQQQHIIRQTHQHVQSPPESPQMREQDRKKLANGEADLGQAVEHLYAKMAGEMENKPIGEALDHLAKAEKSLDAAGKSLRDDLLPEGQKQERAALADLVATRKAFQKAVSENPQAFAEQSSDETPPTAESKDKLKEIAEFRNEEKAAQDFMEKLAQKQTALANQAKSASTTRYSALAGEETQIQQSLKEFKLQHPQVFKPVRPETDAAERSLDTARQSLQNKTGAAGTRTQDAAQKMQQLAQAMKERSAERQLSDAYKLKQVIDRQIQTFGQCQNPGPGGGPSAAQVKQAAADSRQALQQLKDIAEQSPARDAFGPELRESLSTPNMMALNWTLGELDQPASAEARKKTAGQAKEGLEKVSKAFEASQPKAMQMARQAAKPGQQSRSGDFARGLAQLDSLVKQLESRRPVSREDQARQGREALYNLQSGLPEKGSGNERAQQILLRLEKELQRGEQPPDVEILKSAMDALQAISIEMIAQRNPKEDNAEVTGVDPSRLPPAYRARIEKYFQKLSER